MMGECDDEYQVLQRKVKYSDIPPWTYDSSTVLNVFLRHFTKLLVGINPKLQYSIISIMMYVDPDN